MNQARIFEVSPPPQAEIEPIRPGAGFEDLTWLFTCDNRNRGIIRQNFNEAALLWKAVKATRGDILEIGRSKGGSTALLVTAAAGRRVTSVDIAPRPSAICEKFLASPEFAGSLELMVGDSRQSMPQREFGFMFIDGDHSLEGVIADLKAHWPALRPPAGAPALCAFHDAAPNDGLWWRESKSPWAIRFRQLKNLFRRNKKPPYALNYDAGVQIPVQNLVDLQVARVWGKACSMVVLEKRGELPADLSLLARPLATPAA